MSDCWLIVGWVLGCCAAVGHCTNKYVLNSRDNTAIWVVVRVCGLENDVDNCERGGVILSSPQNLSERKTRHVISFAKLHYVLWGHSVQCLGASGSSL